MFGRQFINKKPVKKKEQNTLKYLNWSKNVVYHESMQKN